MVTEEMKESFHKRALRSGCDVRLVDVVENADDSDDERDRQLAGQNLAIVKGRVEHMPYGGHLVISVPISREYVDKMGPADIAHLMFPMLKDAYEAVLEELGRK